MHVEEEEGIKQRHPLPSRCPLASMLPQFLIFYSANEQNDAGKLKACSLACAGSTPVGTFILAGVSGVLQMHYLCGGPGLKLGARCFCTGGARAGRQARRRCDSVLIGLAKGREERKSGGEGGGSIFCRSRGESPLPATSNSRCSARRKSQRQAVSFSEAPLLLDICGARQPPPFATRLLSWTVLRPAAIKLPQR